MRPAPAAGVLVLVAALAGCASDGGSAADGGTSAGFADTSVGACAEQPDQPAEGAQTMPDVQLDCPAGGTLDLGRAPGVPTVVNLWASWCQPCQRELPLVQQLAERAGDQLAVVGVISKDGVPQASSFAADAGVTFPTAFDGDGELMAGLGIANLPYTYFLDADGALVHVEVGELDSEDELVGLVAQYLGVQL